MAKDKKTGKFQFVFVNLEGDDETIQEALRQVGGVLNRGMNPTTRTLIAVPTQKVLADGNSGGSLQQVYEVVDEETPAIDTEATAFTSSTLTAPKPKKAKKAPPIPPLLKDFDPNSAEVSFVDFVNQKDISTDFNKYLVIAAWFKKYKDQDQITTSHIYTCYQLMKWKAPNDMGRPFRNMKQSRSYFEKGSGDNVWKITIIGLNEVDNKMKLKNNRED